MLQLAPASFNKVNFLLPRASQATRRKAPNANSLRLKQRRYLNPSAPLSLNLFFVFRKSLTPKLRLSGGSTNSLNSNLWPVLKPLTQFDASSHYTFPNVDVSARRGVRLPTAHSSLTFAQPTLPLQLSPYTPSVLATARFACPFTSQGYLYLTAKTSPALIAASENLRKLQRTSYSQFNQWQIIRSKLSFLNVVSKKTRGHFFSFYTYKLRKEFLSTAVKRQYISELWDTARETSFNAISPSYQSQPLLLPTVLSTGTLRLANRSRLWGSVGSTLPQVSLFANASGNLPLRSYPLPNARTLTRSAAKVRRAKPRRPNFRPRTRLLKQRRQLRAASLSLPSPTLKPSALIQKEIKPSRQSNSAKTQRRHYRRFYKAVRRLKALKRRRGWNVRRLARPIKHRQYLVRKKIRKLRRRSPFLARLSQGMRRVRRRESRFGKLKPLNMLKKFESLNKPQSFVKHLMAQLSVKPKVRVSRKQLSPLLLTPTNQRLEGLPLANLTAASATHQAKSLYAQNLTHYDPIARLWSSRVALKYLLLLPSIQNRKPIAASLETSPIPLTGLVVTALQNQLTSYCFGPRLDAIGKSNIWAIPSSQYVIRKKLLRFSARRRFRVDMDTWSHRSLIHFAESVSGKHVALNFGPFVEDTLTFDDRARCAMWNGRVTSFQRRLGHKIFVYEALMLVAVAIRLKDPTFLANWIRGMLKRTSFWKYRVIFRYLKFLIQHIFRFSFQHFQFRGFKLRLKGKVGVAGCSRARQLFFKVGDTSHSKMSNKVAYDLSYVNTFTGVLGFKLWFFY